MEATKLLQSVKKLQTKEDIIQWLYKNITPIEGYETIAELILYNRKNEVAEEKVDSRITVTDDLYNQILKGIDRVLKVDSRGRISDYEKLGYVGAMKKIFSDREGMSNSLINYKLRELWLRERIKRHSEGVDIENFQRTFVNRSGVVVNLPEELAELSNAVLKRKELAKLSPFDNEEVQTVHQTKMGLVAIPTKEE